MRKLIYLLPLFLLFACAEDKKGSETNENPSIEGFVEGKILFERNCAACHQKSGAPQVKIYPPLKNSDYLQANQHKIACIIRNGVNENLTVNGKEYTIKMQGFSNFSAQEIGQISNYISNAWGNDFGVKTTEQVIEELKNCE